MTWGTIEGVTNTVLGSPGLLSLNVGFMGMKSENGGEFEAFKI
jgi:hypothetical protein